MRSTRGWRRCSRAASSSRISTVSVARRWCWSIRKRSESHVGRRTGLGAAAVNVDWYLSRQKKLQGAGLDPAVVPGALHAALTVLERWGTMSFEEVAAAGDRLRGAWVPDAVEHGAHDSNELKFFERWPGNKTYWLKLDGSIYKPARPSSCRRRPARCGGWSKPNAAAKARGRAAGIVAARDRFYKGDIAREMVAFLQQA